jgi:uncharacterized membrane protein YeaQ/YmgE (transglycosylase-associated protein family)
MEFTIHPHSVCVVWIDVFASTGGIARRNQCLLGKEIHMTVLDFIILLIVAAVCGVIGQAIAGYSVGGCIASTLVGFVGAVIGTWIAGWVGLPEIFAINVGGRAFPIVWSVIGSAVFVAFLAIFSRGRVTL